ncbi:helix-turn-helix domain-containing protein [Nocardioides sp. SOB77]|uniref:Helix-turn-helix domain-containing protein n=1 Tax=Nocardioides oceani TaxID=3058369 RepID=A0ABT8FMP8_9ACTN|nr:helix-turn-helix domain-containing protein [Nocardioides oceani]MDN4175824.1 helix-turn-helix domain-containing protein [Nocardioides oceani]
MPRHVDHDGRRSRIVKVTMGLLATGGLRAVTIREVARQLGGSVTLVTHYYPTRSAILDDLASQLIEIWRQEVADIDAGTDEPIERLRQYLAWALPTRAEALRREQARIRLLAERESEPSATATFQAFDATMRWDLRRHLEGLVDDESLEFVVDLLRVAVTGVTVLAVEHEGRWTPKKQLQFADQLLVTVGIMEPDSPSP